MVKLQLNSVSAVERLIGGDTTAEVELRQAIAEEFSKRHLKSLVNTEAMQVIKDQIIKEFRYNYGTYTAPQIVTDIIKETTNKLIAQIIHSEVSKIIEENKWIETMNKIVREQSDYIVNQLSEATIDRRLNLLVDKKIKEKLNIQ